MQKQCTQCSANFKITDADLAFYDKVSPVFNKKKFQIPPPTLCPECRQQRRLAFLNIRNLYTRKSSATGKNVISIYSEEKPMPIYESSYWWSDKWNPLDYCQDVDLEVSTFEQVKQLRTKVPHMALVIQGNENAEYVNYAGWDKNCYLCFCTDHSEDCMYTEDLYYCKNTVDCSNSFNLERCYECTDCQDCYNVCHSEQCVNCSTSMYIFDCKSCKNCIASCGRRNQEYVFLNTKYPKEEWIEKKNDFMQNPEKYVSKYNELLEKHIRKEYIGSSNEKSSGNYIYNCKNTIASYDCINMEDSAYCNNMKGGGHHCYDIERWGHPAEFCYECCGVGEGASTILFSICCWNGISNLLYCYFCIGCSDCFGCVGLKNMQYCIYNKQYEKVEYEKVVAKIIDSMKKSNEWGEFFPIHMSPFSYNESAAQIEYPLEKGEVESRGWQWKDIQTSVQNVTKIIAANQLPRDITNIPDDILNWAIECSITKRPYKIVKQELAFYRDMNLPIPKLHPDERHKLRMLKRNPRKLFKRNCAKCNNVIQTTYSPERPEKVLCEGCYLKEVY